MRSEGGGTPIFGCLIMLAIAITQLVACFALLDYWGWHPIVAIAVMAIVLWIRGALLIAIGCFFGAMWGWGWPWYGAIALAAPGLVLGVLAIAGVATAEGAAALMRSADR